RSRRRRRSRASRTHTPPALRALGDRSTHQTCRLTLSFSGSRTVLAVPPRRRGRGVGGPSFSTQALRLDLLSDPVRFRAPSPSSLNSTGLPLGRARRARSSQGRFRSITYDHLPRTQGFRLA